MSRHPRLPRSTSLTLAVVFGALPLVLAVAQAAAVDWSDRDAALTAFMVWFTVALGAVPAGLVALSWFCLRGRRHGEAVPRRLPAAVTAASILIADGLVFFAAASAGMLRYGGQPVCIANRHATTLRAVGVSGGGVDALLGDLGPGEDREVVLFFATDGELVMDYGLGAERRRHVLAGYVTGGVASAPILATVQADGEVVTTQPGR